MTSETLLQDEVTIMKKHFGGLISLVKDLKVKVEKMEKNLEPIENIDIREIVEMQSALDKLFEANSNSIRKVENQIREMESEKTKGAKDAEVEEVREVELKNGIKKCRYFNKGYCKYTVTQRRYAKIIWKGKIVKQKTVRKDILKFVSGLRKKQVVEDRTVSSFMILLPKRKVSGL